MSEKITVVIADDHKLIRDSLQQILDGEASIRILGEAETGPQTIDIVASLEPDVVLLNPFLQGTDSGNIIQSIIEKRSKTKVLMLTLTGDETVIVNALKAGAKGYIPKDTSVSSLIRAIQAVHSGELWIERKLMTRFFDQMNDRETLEEEENGTTEAGLTPREEEVLKCLASGSTNKEIAESLNISETTVKSHLNSIFKKLNVTRRLGAILYAINRKFT